MSELQPQPTPALILNSSDLSGAVEVASLRNLRGEMTDSQAEADDVIALAQVIHQVFIFTDDIAVIHPWNRIAANPGTIQPGGGEWEAAAAVGAGEAEAEVSAQEWEWVTVRESVICNKQQRIIAFIACAQGS